MYVCNICGHLVEELTTARVYDDNLLEGYIDETVTACPCCKHGELIEATICAVCGKPFDGTELNGVCECCLEEYETVESALEIGEQETEKVDVNGFIAEILTPDQINKILTKWVEENIMDHSPKVVDFCEYDLSWFSDFVKDKENK